MLSHLANDLLRVVRTRLLVSVAVGRNHYSVGYSGACGHAVRDSCLRLPPVGGHLIHKTVTRTKIGRPRQLVF